MDADGSNPTPLTDTCSGIAIWSPDGTKMTFGCAGSFNYTERQYVMNADGSDERLLVGTAAGISGALWAPDSSQLFFGSSVYSEGLFGEQIFKTNVDGSEPTRLTNDPYGVRGFWLSPDGTKLAFYRENDSGEDEIYVMDSDGSNQMLIATRPGRMFFSPELYWSPDSTRVVFVAELEDDGPQEIYVAYADGSRLFNVTNNPGLYFSPAWSPIRIPAPLYVATPTPTTPAPDAEPTPTAISSEDILRRARNTEYQTPCSQ